MTRRRKLEANGCGITPTLKEREGVLSGEILVEAARDRRTAKVDFGPKGILAWVMKQRTI